MNTSTRVDAAGSVWRFSFTLALVAAGTLMAGCNLDFEKQTLESPADTQTAIGDMDGGSTTSTDTADTADGGDAGGTEVDGGDGCDCPPGTACCDGETCVSLLTEPANCGACGVTCESGLCIEGTCCMPSTTCDARDCGSVANDGCGNAIECGTCTEGEQCSADGLCVPVEVWEPHIPDTGTRLCLRNGDLTSPNCPDPGEPFYGQDGNYTIFPPAYVVDEDVVADEVTGLWWTRNPLDPQSAALQELACSDLSLGGHADWRLPSFSELYTLVDHGRANETYDRAVFADLDTLISSTVGIPDQVISIRFGSGVTNLSSGGEALCVRGTPLPLTRIPTEDTVQIAGLALEFTRTAQDRRHWRDALDTCEALSLAGASDWRMPNAKEMALLYDESTPPMFWPELDLDGFDAEDDGLWSATPDGRREGDVRVFFALPPDTSPIDWRDQLAFLCVRNI